MRIKGLIKAMANHGPVALIVIGMLALPGQAMAVKFSIPAPEVVAPTPNSSLTGIASDGSSGVWFDDVESPDGNRADGYMAHYSPPGSGLTRVHFWPEPEQMPDNGQVEGIAPGLNGDEWFSRPFQSQVSRISSSGTVTNFNLPGHVNRSGILGGDCY